MKADSDVDEVTLDGRLFHTRKAATGNAQTVEWHIGSTTSVDIDAYLRCCRESISTTLSLCLLGWTWYAVALSDSIGLEAADWRPRGFSLRKPA